MTFEADNSFGLNALRIGQGIDSHRIGSGKSLRLGGIDIECELSLIGHSDADVLLHAVTDAICAAAMLPDIGELFPDNASENKGRDSADFLREAVRLACEAKYALINLDCVVRIERPKISPHKQAIRSRIAEIIGVGLDRISLKAKTGEKIGDVGEGRLAEAYCIALLQRVQ